MNRSVRQVLNFFAFNLLFFSLYLNFIQKDTSDVQEKKNPLVEQANNTTALVKKPETAEGQKAPEPVFKTR